MSELIEPSLTRLIPSIISVRKLSKNFLSIQRFIYTRLRYKLGGFNTLRRDFAAILTVVFILLLSYTTLGSSEEGDDSLEMNVPQFSAEIDDQGNDALSRSGNEQLTNRRKVLARDADLESVTE